MIYRSEAYLCAVGGEESVLVDKEDINLQLHILLKLDEFRGYLDDDLRHVLGIFPHLVPFNFNNKQPQMLSAVFTSSGLTLHPRIPSILTIDQKSAVKG